MVELKGSQGSGPVASDGESFPTYVRVKCEWDDDEYGQDRPAAKRTIGLYAAR
jgi:hypothetical protein